MPVIIAQFILLFFFSMLYHMWYIILSYHIGSERNVVWWRIYWKFQFEMCWPEVLDRVSIDLRRLQTIIVYRLLVYRLLVPSETKTRQSHRRKSHQHYSCKSYSYWLSAQIFKHLRYPIKWVLTFQGWVIRPEVPLMIV